MSPRSTGSQRVRGYAIVVAVVVIAIQLWPVRRTNPPVTSEIAAPPEVAAILRQACYDCHSNETRWPWYAYVAPVSWPVVHHVHEGRGDLNFSEWPTFDVAAQKHAFEDIYDEVEEGEMPLRAYTWLHADARLSDGQRQIIVNWARREADAAGED